MTFSDLSGYFKKLETTPSRNAMTEILADLFRHTSAMEIGKICYLLQGRVGPLYDAIEFGVADKFVIRAIAQAYGMEVNHVVSVFKKNGDLGATAEECYHVLEHDNKERLLVSEVYDRLYGLAVVSGVGSQEKKITILSELLKDMDGLSARYLVRIPLDKLRLGFSDMTILDSLSWMIAGDKSLRIKLEDVYNIRPDIGLLAQSVKEHGLSGLSHVKAKVGAPILSCLCQRLPTADEMIEKMGTVAVEPKYDGVRVAIHYERAKGKGQKENVKTFSRNLENTSAMFPELLSIGKQIDAEDVILDSEAVGVDPKTGRLVSFQETTTRKRKHDIAEATRNLPLKFFVFDILFKDGMDLLSLPLSERRSILEKTVTGNDILTVSPEIITDSAYELRTYHDSQLKKGLEGAVVKKWNSPYEPGRRGFSWVKFKEEEGKTGKLTDTIDAVVMGYYRGEGKRTGFGIGAFLVGVKKGEAFVTVTKIGTGVSDLLFKELKIAFSRLSSVEKPKEYENVHKSFLPDVWIHPKIVVEIAGDDLTKSSTHGATVAVRFPRLVRIRTDKSAKNVTTVKELHSMYMNQ